MTLVGFPTKSVPGRTHVTSSGEKSPVEGTVVYLPLSTKVLYTSKRVVGLGISEASTSYVFGWPDP